MAVRNVTLDKTIRKLLNEKKYQTLKDILVTLEPADISAVFEELDEEVVWHVRQENIYAAMETEVHCLKKDMLLINYEAPDGSRHHNRLWNGGNGWGTVKLYDREDGQLILTDEIEASHIGCEYGEYDHGESY